MWLKWSKFALCALYILLVFVERRLEVAEGLGETQVSKCVFVEFGEHAGGRGFVQSMVALVKHHHADSTNTQEEVEAGETEQHSNPSLDTESVLGKQTAVELTNSFLGRIHGCSHGIFSRFSSIFALACWKIYTES